MVTLLVFAGALLIAVEDFALSPGSNGLSRSPAWLFFLVAALTTLRSSTRKVRRFVKFGNYFIAYVLIVSVLWLLFTPATDLFEAVRGLVSTTIWFAVIAASGTLLANHIAALRRGMAAALFVLFAISAIEQQGIASADDLTFLHEFANGQQRTRATRIEASSLGAAMIIIATCLGALAQRPKRSTLFITFAVVAAVPFVTESRGTLIAVGGTCFVAAAMLTPAGVILRSALQRKRWSTVVGLCVVVGSLASARILASPLWLRTGLQGDVSDATRSAWSEVSLGSLFQHPYGFGFSAYLDSLPQYFVNFYNAYLGAFGSGNLSEVALLASQPDALTFFPKTLPTVAVVYGGFIGLVAVILLYTLMLIRAANHSSSAIVAACSFLIVTASYYVSPFNWEVCLAIAIILFRSSPKDDGTPYKPEGNYAGSSEPLSNQ